MEEKTQISFIQAHSIRDLIERMNAYNNRFPDSAITQKDIAGILKEEDTYILLYYK